MWRFKWFVQELEWREKQYDVRLITDILDADDNVVVHKALTYVGSSDPTQNLNWGGAAPLPELAQQIAHAVGPSGPNYEYLYLLANGLRDMHVSDQHVYELEELVRSIRGDPPAPSTSDCRL
jgi:cation transport regulator ChaC